MNLITGFGVKHKSASALFSREANLLLSSAASTVACNALISNLSSGIQVHSDAVVLGALSADTAPITSVTVDRDEFDLDLPSQGFSSIPEAIEDILKGKVVLHVDVVIIIKSKNLGLVILLFQHADGCSCR